MTDLLLRGARVRPMDPDVRGDAVLVSQGRIERVGDERELRALRPRARVVDLSGCQLLPGLTDTHTHFFEWARRRAGVDLSCAHTMEEVRARLLVHRRTLPAAQLWVVGGGWDLHTLRGQAGFGRGLLDELFPHRPVALESRDFHTLWCNGCALEAAGVGPGTAAPPGGEIGRAENGEPDGFLYETAWELIYRARPAEPGAVAQQRVVDALAAAHALGLTGLHSMELAESLAAFTALRDDNKLRMRVCFHTPLDQLSERIEKEQASYAGDDPWLRLGGVKVFMDGSLGSQSAFMHDAYPDGSRGRLLRSEAELVELLGVAAAAGIAASVHAIGDATVELVARAIARVRREHGQRPLLYRMEHAQCVRPADVEVLAREKIYCAMQAIHLADDIDLLPRLWPTVGPFAYPFRALLTAGVSLGLGSDAPVASLDPCAGVYAAIQRRAHNDPKAPRFHAEQAMTEDEALAAYTIWAARGSRREGELGSITPGKLADLTALDDVGQEPQEWLRCHARLTIVAGEIVHDALAAR